MVRGEDDLHEVLEDVCRTIADLLGYNAVVVNVYRPAYDDMLTASAVGSEDSFRPWWARPRRRTPGTRCSPRASSAAGLLIPEGEFDWEELGIETFVPDIAQ